MQTHADFRIGTLVRWNGDDTTHGGDPADIDELGIVIQIREASVHTGDFIA